MRLLILAIYHETEYYKEMLNVQQIYIQTIKNIYKNIKNDRRKDIYI